MTHIRALIVDDRESDIAHLREKLTEHCPQVEIVQICTSGQEAIAAILRQKPDLVFLDIEMESGMSGFDVIETLKGISLDFSVVFVTRHAEHAVYAFRVSALDFLKKPIIARELEEAVQKARRVSRMQLEIAAENLQSHNKLVRIALPIGSDLEIVQVADLVCLSGATNFTETFLSNRTKPLLVSKLLGDLQKTLEGGPFLRIHHSHLINLDHLLHYERGEGGNVTMSNKKILPVSRSRKADLLRALGMSQ